MRRPIRDVLLSGAVCLTASLLLSGLLVPSGPLRWMAAAAGALLLIPAMLRVTASRQRLRRAKQILHLFQVLLSRVAAGETPESAFQSSATDLASLFGTRTPLVTALRVLSSDLRHRTPLDRALARFTRALDCGEAAVVLQSIPAARQLGNGTEPILRTGRDLMAERLSAEAEAAAQTAQQRTEALVMSVLPFLIGAMMRTMAGDYLADAFSPGGAALFLTILYGCLIGSLAGVLFLLTGIIRPARPPRRSRERTLPGPFWSRLAGRLPALYRLRLEQALRFCAPGRTVPQYLQGKVLLAAAGLAGGLVLVPAAGWMPAAALPLLLPIAQDRDLYRKADRGRRDMLLDFPLFLEFTTAVLRTGLSLPTALELCADGLSWTGPWLSARIRELRAAVRTGQPVSEALERAAARIDVPEIQGALSLLAQSERAGGTEIPALLHLHIAECRHLRRSAMRQLLEQRSLLLMLPIGINLLVILVLAGLPAYLSLMA